MIKYLLPVFILCYCSVFGIDVDKVLNQPRQKVDRIEIVKSDKITLISSDFANSQIQTIDLRDKIKQLKIIKIYYVYTAYRRSTSFNQHDLDRKRFKTLISDYPDLFTAQNFEWEIIEQTGLSDYSKGQSFFHGFIIVHRPLPTKANRAEEVEMVMNYLDNPSIPITENPVDPIEKQLGSHVEEQVTESTLKPLTRSEFDGGDQALTDYIQMNFSTPNEVWKDRKDFWAEYDLVIDENGKVTQVLFKGDYSNDVKKSIEKTMLNMPAWNPKTVSGMADSDTVNFELRVSYSPQLKGMYLKNGQPPKLDHLTSTSDLKKTGELVEAKPVMVNSGVYKSLELLTGNDRLALVMDVTGSMHRNIINASEWVRINKSSLPFSSFTVFNDGDKTPDHKKEIGITRGIYTTTFYDEFKSVVKTGMTNGNGGDYPENDIEAIIHALREDAKATGVLLIADNMSTVKDIELLSNVQKPVSVLICSLTKVVEPQYFEIAIRTGGKLYCDGIVIDFSTLKKGDTFKIRSIVYTYNGRKVTVLPQE